MCVFVCVCGCVGVGVCVREGEGGFGRDNNFVGIVSFGKHAFGKKTWCQG